MPIPYTSEQNRFLADQWLMNGRLLSSKLATKEERNRKSVLIANIAKQFGEHWPPQRKVEVIRDRLKKMLQAARADPRAKKSSMGEGPALDPSSEKWAEIMIGVAVQYPSARPAQGGSSGTTRATTADEDESSGASSPSSSAPSGPASPPAPNLLKRKTAPGVGSEELRALKKKKLESQCALLEGEKRLQGLREALLREQANYFRTMADAVPHATSAEPRLQDSDMGLIPGQNSALQ